MVFNLKKRIEPRSVVLAPTDITSQAAEVLKT